MDAITTRKLTRKYGTKTAVDGIDLTVHEGELFALLGVNGAGKTTTVRMLTCLSAPTSGEAEVCGSSIISAKDEVKRITGISPQDTSVAEKLTVRENLEFMAKIHGYGKEAAAKRAGEMIGTFGLGDYEKSAARTLSGGWKRKLSIAMALISEPKVLFLDEPTLGLDVIARRELWRTVEKLKGTMTIILTTHYMEEAEALSDRIAIMTGGRFAAVGTLAEIEETAGVKGLENAFVAIVEKEAGK